VRLAAGVAVVAVLLAACDAGGGQSDVARSPVSLPLKAQAKQKLIYVSDPRKGAVEVFDYPDGPYVGETTGFEYPYGECSDKNGNVFVADFDAQTISEIAEGTARVMKTVHTRHGYPIGCAVNPNNGDLAVTLNEGGSLGYGSVDIYSGGISGSRTAYTYTDYTWPAGYDGKGDLYAEGAGGSCSACIWTLQAGSSTPEKVTWDGGPYGGLPEYPAAIERSGTMLEFGQQEYDGVQGTAIYPTTCVGTTCRSTSPIVPTDTCGYVEIVQWGEDSDRPNLQSEGKVSGEYAFAGGNLWCNSGNSPGLREWPASGGNLSSEFGPPPYEAAGETIVN
jgi:hypothetical protein